MTVNELYDELKKAIDAGCGNIQIRSGVPYFCVDDNYNIVEDECKFDTEPINLNAEMIIDAKKKKCDGIVVDYNFKLYNGDD